MHLVLLFSGDVMFLYGVCGVAIAVLMSLSDRKLSIIAWIPLFIIALIGIAALFKIEQTTGADAGSFGALGGVADADTYPELIVAKLKVFGLAVATLPVQAFFCFSVMLIGFVWARKGVLADVPTHRPLLTRWFIVALVISFGVGLPWGLAASGILPSEYEDGFMLVNSSLGVFTGPGILAGLTLILNPLQQRIHAGAPMPAWLIPIVALGKRSLSGYLLQSMLFFVLVYPFMLDFPRGLGTAAQTGIATGVWLITLVSAWLLELRGIPGPFEKLHRRISYGPTMRPEL